MTRRVEITVSEDTWARLNEARGHEPRASFVKRALESALGPAEPYAFEAERRAVRAAVDGGAESVRVEVGSIVPERPPVLKRGSQVELRFRCPVPGCSRRFGSGAATCPEHARKAVES